MNLINPIFALVTVALKRNIFYADGTRINLFGRLVKGDVAEAPAEAHEKAMKALERIRAEEAR